MDSTNPRTQPPQQQQRQQHPTQTNPQQPPPQQQQQQQQPQQQHQQQPQPQQLHQQPNIHPPQHAQQNQSTGYAPQQQQPQHAYQTHQLQFHHYPQAPYRHAYTPQQYPHQHIPHQTHYPYAYAGHPPFQQQPWTPTMPPFTAAPVSTPPTQGLPATPKAAAPLPTREKRVLTFVDPKTKQPINLNDGKGTNKSQKNETNNKTKQTATIAPPPPASITISSTATSAPTAATLAAAKTTITRQSTASTTPTTAANKNSAATVKANSATTSKSEPTVADRTNTSSPPSVSNILLQKVSEDTDTSKRPAATPATPAVTTSPNKPKEVTVPTPNVKTPEVADAKLPEVSPALSETVKLSAKTTPPKEESSAEPETIVKKDVVDNVKEEVATDKKDEALNDVVNEDDSTKGVVAADDETKLHYETGQYHPTSNRNGKKKYSRNFMVEVCEKICKLNIFNEGPNDNNLSGSYPQLDLKIDMFAPPYQQQQNFSSANNRLNDPMRRQNPNNYMGRSSAGQERQRKVIPSSSSLTNEVELKTVSNPWRPGMDKKEDVPLDAAEVEALKKKFRSILNKLTPNNFDKLAPAVTELGINTEQKLAEVIDIVFAKALAEPGYCVLYGQMCSHLKKISAGTANFGNTLLKRCQHQFVADIYSGLNVDERKKKIEEEQDPEVKKQLGEELYEEMYRSRMRGLGLIKFIGELYKIEMLNDEIMFDCIHRLIHDSSSEESLECLCDLLTTIGEKLDRSSQKRAREEKKSQKSAPKPGAYTQGGKSIASVLANSTPQKVPEPITTLDPIFENLHKIRKNKELPLSLRIRFKLLDVCDLREKENWQSKKAKDNNPKKIEEIREAHNAKLESERQKQAMSGRRSQEGRRGLGHASGSSSHISSLGNDSRGGMPNMHTSASSQAIRDQSFGDNRQQTHSDSHKMAEQHQQNLGALKFLSSFKVGGKDTKEELRPTAFLRPAGRPVATNNANSNSSSKTKSDANNANGATSGSQ